MENIKRWIGKCGGERLRNIIIWFLRITKANNKIILFSNKKAKRNRVNVNYWSEVKNLGDAISPVIVDFVAKENGVDPDKNVKGIKHLYAVGSIITAGCQDCTIWGSGILNTQILSRIKKRKLDIRAVRGPLTRLILKENGYKVPKIYGDPAIIMPLIYNPDVEKQYKVSVISHMNEHEYEFKNKNKPNIDYHTINIVTDDYKTFIKEIKQSELVVSSSLHGIILAEVYGVPAILLRPHMDFFKYYDFYYSTKRFDFPVADSIEQATKLTPPEIPDYTKMRENILKAFPKDLWM